MKNLCKFVLVLGVFLSSFAFGQEFVNKNAESLLSESKAPRKYKIACITTSCCGVGSFGFDIWEHTVCSYILLKDSNSRFTVMSLKNADNTEYTKDEVTLENDFVLYDKDKTLENEGFIEVMVAGKYKVIDGQVAFQAKKIKVQIKTICNSYEHSGTILGHEYSYSYMACVSYPSFSYSKGLGGGYAEIDLSSNIELLKKVSENNGNITFENDLQIGDDYILAAGNYHVEDNGKIYTRNVNLK